MFLLRAFPLFAILLFSGQSNPAKKVEIHEWSVEHQFEETTSLVKSVNDWLKKWFLSWHGENSRGWCEATYFDPRNMISALIDWSEYYPGAAHPNSHYEGYTFIESNGTLRILELSDFFRDGSAYRQLVSNAVIGKLKNEDGASEVRNGHIKALTSEQLERFVVAPDGLLFLFNQYEVGPYSAGRFKVKLTFKELGPDFRLELIRQR